MANSNNNNKITTERLDEILGMFNHDYSDYPLEYRLIPWGSAYEGHYLFASGTFSDNGESFEIHAVDGRSQFDNAYDEVFCVLSIWATPSGRGIGLDEFFSRPHSYLSYKTDRE